MEAVTTNRWRGRLWLLGGGLVVAVGLVIAARVRPDWPWFSLWLVGLLATVGALSVTRVRSALGLSPFRVTLVVLTGVSLFNLFLFHVETHRQRSERLEIEGVWFDANKPAIRVGVGDDDLDVRLAGSLYDFDRWSLELRPVGDERFAVEAVSQVDMLRLRAGEGWRPGVKSVLGRPLTSTQPVATGLEIGDSIRLEVSRTGGPPRIVWGDAGAPLSLEDPLLDRRLGRQLAAGLPLAELEWDALPDRALAEDLAITRVSPGRRVGRLRLTLPSYRLTSRSDAGEWNGDAPIFVHAGDTLWIRSRAKRWAIAVDQLSGVSRVAAPSVVRFVERPRSSGWALPSAEACGRDADRCAVLSSRPLPPPQPQFDLAGFGLDTARYSVLARLETDAGGIRLVGARETHAFEYGEVAPFPARASDPDDPAAGLLLQVQRAAEGRRSAVALTVFGLFCLMLGALLIASGDLAIWRVGSSQRPHARALWGLLNVFIVFLGLRLALGLRVAYTPPFYERAAVTAVGMWVTFAVLIVGLARWPSWSPRLWRLVRRLERPVSNLFLPGVRADEPTGPGTSFTLVGESEERLEAERRARGRGWIGAVLFVPALGGLLWQRPAAAAGVFVAAAALAGWVAMGIARRRGGHWPLNMYPLRVLTADAETNRPSVAFALTAGASIVLVLAMHAPLLAVAPVAALLLLFGVDGLARLGDPQSGTERRGWLVAAAAGAMVVVAALLFAAPAIPAASVTVAALAGVALWLRRPVEAGGPRRIAGAVAAFDDLRTAVLSGVGWIGVLIVLAGLVFLSTQAIPPFVRFALVFTLFLLAIRAGLACNRVLNEGTRWGRVEALALLGIPVGVLLVFMLFDFGLGLVFFVPMFITVLLSARVDRLPGTLTLAAVAVVALIGIAAGSVLRPSLDAVQAASNPTAFDEEFRGVGNPLVDALRAAGLGGPITRATVRSIAASEPALLEDALALAGPSDALVAAAPSLEQVWGGRAYAASGWTGTGFAGTTLLGRGIPTAVSFAENTFSVFVLSEHGALGGLAVLLAYLSLLAVAGLWIVRVHGSVQDTPLGLAVVALTVGGVAWLTLPAAYVAASNLGVVPLTGQNMPFLGLNSWADVVLVCGLATGILSGLAAMDAAETDPMNRRAA